MKRHLTERELIEYQFKLSSETLAEETARHLADCGQCRKRLAQIERKFAALDLLGQEISCPEELILRAAELAKARGPAKAVPFRRYAWVGAAAAVLMVAALIIIPSLKKAEEVSGPRVARQPKRPVAEDRLGAGEEIVAADTDRETTAARGLTVKETEKVEMVKEAGGVTAGYAVDMSGREEISEQPPFAPASAIELVTLPKRDKVQITIYNSADLTLVRERRNLTLKRGWNWLQFMWANTLIDPTSLSVEPKEHADKIDIQQLVYPARLREVGRWLIRSEVSGQVPFEITYFTSGLSWRAFYVGTLSADERSVSLQGYVRVANSSGEDYEDAQTRLIVGKVHLLDEIAELARRKYPYGRPKEFPPHGGSAPVGLEREEVLKGDAAGVAGVLDDFKGLRRKEIKKEGLSEYFLYTIEGMETIPNGWGKRLVSFEAEDVAVKSLYKYDEGRWGRETIRFVAFANDEEHNLGETPIPNGQVKIYARADEQGYLSYVGGSNVKYIPVDEEVELNLGPARKVTVEPRLMDFATDSYVYDRKGNIGGWDEIRTWKIEVTNTREMPVEVEITRGFGTAYWTLQRQNEEVSYGKHDATHARFTLEVKPRSKREINYTVTTYHGVREEALTE